MGDGDDTSEKEDRTVATEVPASLPTIREAIERWLGVQLPGLPPMPQTLKNLDKACGRLLLAGSSHLEENIRHKTRIAKVTNKAELDALFRSTEERIKFENKAEITRIAFEDLGKDPETDAADAPSDAPREIEDDWLNFFARAAEDKSSDELRQIFGRILSGEIKRPGSFSLRTLQFLSTLSKKDAEEIADFLSYAVLNAIAIRKEEKTNPTINERVLMEERGIITGATSTIGGLQRLVTLPPGAAYIPASRMGIMVTNNSGKTASFGLPAQVLTQVAIEIMKIAVLKATDLDYLREIGNLMATEMSKADKDGKSGRSTISILGVAGNQRFPIEQIAVPQL